MEMSVKIHLREEELSFHREIPNDASQNDKLTFNNNGGVQYFSTLGRQAEYQLKALYHYHEFTGNCVCCI
jgi:hypothetical protein